MPTNILAIQPRRQDLRTQTNVDWAEGFPIFMAGDAGVVRGQNIGSGTIAALSVAPQAAFGGYAVTVTEVSSLTALTVTAPDGTVIGRGYVGAPISAGGLLLTLAQGDTPFVVGDAFAIQPVPVAIDTSGISWALELRQTKNSANVILSARSNPTDGTAAEIIDGGATGVTGLFVPQYRMSGAKLPPGSYVYDLIAMAENRRVVAYYGALTHEDGVTFLP